MLERCGTVMNMPRTADVDERRAELAAAATRVIARRGMSGTTLREVAAEAGSTTGALTHYFADKRELLRFTLETLLDLRYARRQARAGLDGSAALEDTLLHVLPSDKFFWLACLILDI